MEHLDELLRELLKQRGETEWLEFKQGNADPAMIGQRISALANSAALHGRECGYLVWGVEDATHRVVGTVVRLREQRRGNEELESWLHHQLSSHADFQLRSVEHEGKHVEMIIVMSATQCPIEFEKLAYIRVGSYTKALRDHPKIQQKLWARLANAKFEEGVALPDLRMDQVRELLDCDAYFVHLKLPLPTDSEKCASYLVQDAILQQKDNGLYSITNLGALLFARRLSAFGRLGRKAIRVVQWEGEIKGTMRKEELFDEGYVMAFESAVRHVDALLPSREAQQAVQRTLARAFPLQVIREAVANALIHQDFSLSGSGVTVELFDGRIEVTNPGYPLVDAMRIVDSPPRSRNEGVASLMRRMGYCEELGRGWDSMVQACELARQPSPRIRVYSEATCVEMRAYTPFSSIPQEERIWAAYLHATLRYMAGDALTNASLRERFGLQDSDASKISRLIAAAVKEECIRPLDAGTAKRHMRYVPAWV